MCHHPIWNSHGYFRISWGVIMKICVYGLWHLGLVTTAGLVKLGHTVVGLDDFDMCDLNRGMPPIYEKGVEESLHNGFKNNTLSFTNDCKEAFQDIDIVWVTFDTPVDEYDVADIKYIETRIMRIIPYIQDKTKLIISSQVPVGFIEKLERMLLTQHPDKKIYIAYSPENLRLGDALERFINPDRIIIGTHPDEQSIFEPFFKTISNNLIWMTIPSAEMTKHAVNTYLAMSICFANEIAKVCDNVGALSGEVELGLKSDNRIGQKAYVRAGDAYSGGTLARDVKSLQYITLEHAIESPLLDSISDSNECHKDWIGREITKRMNVSGKTIMVFGLVYKEGTSTLRRSGPLELCDWLYKQQAIVYAHDPFIISDAGLPDYIQFVDDLNNMPKECDCVVILKDPYPLISLHMLDMMIGDALVIDPNGYLQPKKNGRKYFSVRRLI